MNIVTAFAKLTDNLENLLKNIIIIIIIITIIIVAFVAISPPTFCEKNELHILSYLAVNLVPRLPKNWEKIMVAGWLIHSNSSKVAEQAKLHLKFKVYEAACQDLTY